jgi:hypothetical protein
MENQDSGPEAQNKPQAAPIFGTTFKLNPDINWNIAGAPPKFATKSLIQH